MTKASCLLVAVALISLTACSPTPNASLPAGVTLIEKVQASDDTLVIPYSKYRLANGLTLIVHEDHSDPLVHVDVTYHVGSSREEPGQSGFAHFFEHMMFQGTEHVADEEHFRLITEAGGTMNGTTSSDRTNYYQTVPVNQLETVLWLESDRMGFLLDAVTQEKFEVQRETVKNERGQRVDNQPYGRLGESVAQALYPPDHPYSWPVIGWMEDLNRVNVNDLKKFFLRWYGPNNATLTVGGDVNSQEVVRLVDKYFGDIPAGPAVSPPTAPEVALDRTRYLSLQDNVHLPLLYIAYPTVEAFHPDEAALDVLMQILGSGRNSLLYQNLVKSQQAVQAQASHGCSELACQFALLALPHPSAGMSLDKMEQAIRDSLQEFEQRGVTQDDLDKIKVEIYTDAIFGLQSVQGKVSQLASYETFLGNPDFIQKQVDRYKSVSKEDVMRVYDKYIKDQPSVVMSIVPAGQPQLAAREDNYQPPVRPQLGPSDTKAEDLSFRTTPKTFDRSVRPKPGPNPAVTLPVYWQDKWANGIEILGTDNPETPTTALLLRVQGGAYQQAPEKAGVAGILAAMLTEDTQLRSSEEMSRALDKLGSSILVSATDESLDVFVNSLSENLPQTLNLLEEFLFMPAFNPDDFDRIKNRAIESVRNAKKNPGYLANEALRELLYGKDSIAGMPRGGTEQSLASISLADVKNYYQTWFKPAEAELILVSDLDKQAIFANLDKMQAWTGSAPDAEPVFGEPVYQPGSIYLVNKDEAAQSAIRIGKRGLKKDFTGEFYRTGLMNFPLGGAFNSRINLNLREDKGYTYGAGSGFGGDSYVGRLTVSADVRADVTVEALKELYGEIRQYAKEGIDKNELAFLRLAINQQDALEYETPYAKLSFLAQILKYDLEPGFVKARARIVDNITAKEINALAEKHLQLDEMVTVIVGDAETLKPKLQELDKPVMDYHLE
ncbi:M16 family metallopeptidase [Bowmanella dokdonensis]|uniref:Insulinase family protein n=1 Tax=Bowmanella dokdonensis TaxID=751969 RepID=A0A939DNK1_9ALTE|nr:pitrilysin family protein [Bowmanella dokdonensis]MBN7825066.1 insulinase family protein [Bowmanella dokdonensis]